MTAFLSVDSSLTGQLWRGPDAMQDMQDLISPEDYQRMMSRAFKNLPKLFGGDSPLGKLFEEGSRVFIFLLRYRSGKWRNTVAGPVAAH